MVDTNNGYLIRNDSGLGMGEVDFLTKVNSDDRLKMKECTEACPGTCQKYYQPKVLRNIFKSIYDSYKTGEFADAILRSEDNICFPVHRIVLCGESDYFRALFSSSVNSKEQTDIKLHKVSNEMLEIAIHFMYTHEACLNNANVTEVLRIADYLGIIPLKNLCCDFIGKKMESKNVVGIYQFAKENFCLELEAKAKQFIMKNFTAVSQCSDEFLHLPVKEVASIFGSEKLNVKNEETVWLAVVRWINHEPEERKNHIVELLKQIRTGLMDTNFFVENVKDHPFVLGNDAVRPLIIETIRFLYDLQITLPARDYISFSNTEIAKPRLPNEIIFAIGGWSGGAPTNVIETYDTRADRWRELSMEHLDPTPRAYHGTISIGHEIIVIGGFDGINYFNSVRSFHAITKKWKYLAPMSERRCYVAVTKLDGLIYVFGGYDGHHRLNTCERYDRGNNQWSQLTPMNNQRSDASATSYDGKIYVVGGFSGADCLMCAEMYDPSTNQWSYISSMRNRRSGVSCMAYQGYIYVLGGFNGISRLCSGEKYNPITGAWSPICDMYNPRSNFACTIVDDMLFAIGGFNGFSTISHVECYDGKNREWYEATDLHIFRSALTCCVLSDLPNIQEYIHENRAFLIEERRQRLMSGPPQIAIMAQDPLHPPNP